VCQDIHVFGGGDTVLLLSDVHYYWRIPSNYKGYCSCYQNVPKMLLMCIIFLMSL